MRFAPLLLLLLPSFAMADDFLDDPASHRDEQLAEDVRAINDGIAAITAKIDVMTVFSESTTRAIQDLESRVGSLEAAPMLTASQPVGMSHCECQCPTIDEIRAVVREELDRVTITVKSASGQQRSVEVPLTTQMSRPAFSELQPGETVIAIDGVSVTPFTYQGANQQPAVQYRTPQYDMRTFGSGGSFFGAVRQTLGGSTCRMVNGRMQCN